MLSSPTPYRAPRHFLKELRSRLDRTRARPVMVLELCGDDDYVVESEGVWAREHADLLGLPFKPRPYETLSPPLVRAQWLSLAGRRHCRVVVPADSRNG